MKNRKNTEESVCVKTNTNIKQKRSSYEYLLALLEQKKS